MARYAIDASTLLFAVTSGGTLDQAHQLVAPHAIRSRALDRLLRQVRSGALREREALAQHERLTETKMRLLGDRLSRRTAWNLAREQGRDTIEWAEYLAIARLQADALVTIDKGLQAKACGIVPTAAVDVLFVTA